MSFESGTMNIRAYYLPRELPEDFTKRLAAHAACGLESVTADLSAGWVTGRHLLDRNITEETIFYAGYLRLALRLAQRQVPSSLLQAECRMEEIAAGAAEGQPFLNRRKRAEIRQAVMERLLPAQTPRLTGISLVHCPGSAIVYAAAMSDLQGDMLLGRWQQTMGFPLVPATAETIARERCKIDVGELMPVSFSPDVDDALMEPYSSGRDFLTWLWFKAETGRGTVPLSEVGGLGVLMEGPVTFKHEGSGSHVTLLRNGEPMGSAEAKACLMAGKKLSRCRLTFGLGDELWKCAFDADAFLIRSLVVPEEQGLLDPISRFQCRMHNLDRFTQMLHGLYQAFLEDRTDKAAWPQTKTAIREWARSRSARV